MNRFCTTAQKFFLACLLVLSASMGKAQTTLVAGDIAFSGYTSNTVAGDEFSFVLLRAITANTSINFTDNGWLSTNVFRTGETTVTWTSTTAMAAGTEIKINGTTATLVGGAAGGTVTGTALSLSTVGDQILAFQGTAASPTFISAIHMNVFVNGVDPFGVSTTAAAWDGTANSVSGSALPTGLTTGVNAIWIGTQDVSASEFDNSRFTGCALDLSTAALARAALNNQANWTSDISSPPGFTLPTGCSYIVAVAAPTFTVNPTSTSVCVGANASFTVTATNAINYQWQVDIGGGSFTNITNDAIYSGATTNTLNITAAPFSFNGNQYRCVASNGSGSTNSTPATLTVTVLPTAPTLLAKTPATATVADGTPVSATFNAGSGGTGCSDDYRYTTNGGASYLPYTPGSNISTTGLTAGTGVVTIEGRRANCSAGCQGTYTALATWVVTPLPAVATTLNAGDLAFSSYAAANDEFSFVLLRNIGAGTTVNFTNNGWLSTNVFRTGEESVTWTSNAAYGAGTEIKISGLTATSVSGGSAGTVTGTALSLNGTGDQILAYRGTAASPTFISAIHMNVLVIGVDPFGLSTTAAAWDGTANSVTTSALPTGLTTGVNAIWIGTQDVSASEFDNARYGNCSNPATGGSISLLRAALNNQANWTKNNNAGTPGFVIPTGCNYLQQVAGPSITANPSNVSICAGANASFTITATGATTYQWQVNTGSGFVNITDDAIYSGATTASLLLTAPPIGYNGYLYQCVVSNGSGSATSTSATLTITALPTAPSLLAKTPAANTVADGTPVSATFTAGSGGTGCSDDYRYSTDGGATYLPYTPGSNISTTGLATGSGWVFIEGRRAACSAGCQGVYTVLASWYVTPLPAAATTLGAGDIAFSSYASTTEEFSFVLIRNVGAGTTINFTNNGWLSTNVFRTGEETVTWTAPAGGLTAGSEIKIAGLTATKSGGGAAGTVTGTALSLNGTGDQILAYRGSAAAPTFIAAIHMNVFVNGVDPFGLSTTAAAWDGTANSASASALPTGLTTGVNAIWIGTQDVSASEFDNAAYGNCAGPGTLGPLTGLRAALNNQANWIRNNNPVPGFATPTCNFLGLLAPAINVTGTPLTAFSACAGTASGEQNFTVSGNNLTTGIVITAPTGFEVSTTSGSGFATSLTLPHTGGSVANTIIYVRMAASATGTPSGNITLASTGVTTINVAVSGTVNPVPATPTISAAGPTTFCAGGTVVLTSSAATGNLWSTGATTQSITVGTSGTYTVTVTTAGCSSATSAGTTVTVNPTPPTPTVTPGGPTTFCAGGSVTLTSSSATGNLWSTGATTQSITVSTGGTYTVTVTSGGCTSAASAGTTVTVNPLPATPTVTPGGPTTFCTGGSVTLTSSSASGNVWSTGETTQSITVTTAGTYTVTVTSGGCTSAPSSGTTVTVNPIPATPTITAGGPTTFCIGGSVTLTSSSATGNLWSTGETTQSITVTTSGTYTVTVTENGCTSAPSAGTIVTVNPIPTTANAGPDITNACVNPGSVNMAANTPTVGTGAWTQIGGPVTTSFATSNPTTLVVGLNTAGTYTYVWTISSGSCPPSRDTMTITVNANPAPFTLVGGGTFCPGTTTLTGPVDPNYTYVWQRSLTGISTPNSFTTFGGTASTQSVTSSGNYRLIVTNQFGCTASDTTPVSMADYVFNGSLAAGDAQQTGRLNRFASLSTCAAPKACPNTFTTAGARFYDSYTITNPRSVPVCATIGLASGCGTSLFNVAYLGSFDPTQLCNNYLADPGSSFPGTGYMEATIPANGTIVVVVHEVNPGTGCANYQLTVDVPRETGITVNPNTPICAGDGVTITAPVANTYSWNPTGSNTQAIAVNPTTTTTYYATLGYGNVGCTTVDSATVIVNPLPTVALAGNDTAICGLTINNLAGNTPTVGTGTWTQVSGPGIVTFTNANAANSTAVATVSGTYVLRWTIATAAPCVNSSQDDVVVNFAATPSTADAGLDKTACVSPGNVSMTAVAPTVGTGFWTQVAGPVTANIISPTLPNTTINGMNTVGTYTFRWTVSNNPCPSSFDEVDVVVNSNPAAFTISGGGTFCASGTTLAGPVDPNYTYLWGKSYLSAPFTSLGTNQTQAATGSGIYQLTVTNQFGCTATATTVVNAADYVFNGSLAAGDAVQTGRLNRFAAISTCAAPKACPGTFTTTGSRVYDSYTITNPRNVPVCAVIGLNSGCGTAVFSAAYSGSFNPTALCTNYLADPGSSPATSIFYEATIPANGTIVVVVHEVNPGQGCANYSLTVDVPRDVSPIVVNPTSVTCASTATLTAPVANSYLWSTGAFTRSITTPPLFVDTEYKVTLGYGNNGCTRADSATVTVTSLPPTITCPGNITANNTTGICGRAVTYTATVGGSPTPTITYAFTGATVASGSGDGSGSVFNVGTTTVTLTATNACGTVNCSFTVTITDNEAPIVTTGTIGSCYPTAAAAEAAALAATTATDNCPGVLTEVASTVGTCSAVVTVRTTDVAGNFTEVTYNTRIDNTAPVVTVGTIGGCYATAAAAEAAALAATTATDNCPGALTEVASTVGTCSAVITVTTTDGCGNATSVTYNTRIDNTPPVVTVGTIGSCYPTVAAAEAAALAATTATDNCPGALIETASTVGTCSAVITVTTQDGCGNSTSITYNTRIDNTAPVVTTGTIGSCYPTAAAAEAAALAATTATDNCPGALTEVASTVGTCSAVITVTTTDGCGNATSVTYNTRIDNTPPTLTCPAPVTVSCVGDIPIVDITTVSNVTDNCPGAIVVTHQGDAISAQTCANRYTITRTYRATDGCGNFTECTQIITVNDQTPPTISCPADITVCGVGAVPAANIALVSGVSDNCGGVVTITHQGDVANSPSATAPYTITRTYRATDVCGNFTECTQTITVNPIPTVNVVADQVVCNTFSTAAINFTSPVAGTTYSWTNDNTAIGLAASGNGSTIGSFVATNTTNAPITATITVTPTANNCPGPVRTFTITVNPTPVANTVANQTLCNGSNTTAVTFSGPVAGTTYSWTNNTTSIGLGASGNGNIPSFTATNTTNAPVTATITVTPSANGCTGAPITFTITVNPTPTVDVVANQTLCNGSPTTAVNFTSPVAGTTYAWTNSNTAIGLAASGNGNIPSFTATNTTNAPITATITVTPTANSCPGPVRTFTITVNPTPVANTVSNQILCNGAPTTAVTFSGPVAGTTYSWTNNTTSIGLAASGNGNIPSFTATNTTNAPVTATITVTPSANGCPGPSITFTILVNPTPVANAIPNQSLCNGIQTVPINFSGPVAGTTYSWTNNNTTIGLAASGNGNIAGFNATNAGATPVTATITVTPSANGCTGTPITFTITVNPTPVVTLAALAPICGNAPAFTLTGGSPAGAGGIYFVNGVPQTSFNPANYAPGVHTVLYQFTNQFGCANTAVQNITVYPVPVSNFTINNSGQCLQNNQFVFTNTSTGAVSYVWNFGDATTSTATNPTKSYAAAGTYTVTLTATSVNGCVRTFSRTVTVYPQPVKPTVVPEFGNGIHSSIVENSYTWYLNGNAITPSNTQYFYPQTAGFYQVQVTTSFGCSTRSDSLYYIPEKNLTAGTDRQFAFVYPIPAKDDVINIHFNIATRSAVNFTLYTVKGQILLTGVIPVGTRNYKIDVRRYPSAAYVLRLTDVDNMIRGIMIPMMR